MLNIQSSMLLPEFDRFSIAGVRRMPGIAALDGVLDTFVELVIEIVNILPVRSPFFLPLDLTTPLAVPDLKPHWLFSIPNLIGYCPHTPEFGFNNIKPVFIIKSQNCLSWDLPRYTTMRADFTSSSSLSRLCVYLSISLSISLSPLSLSLCIWLMKNHPLPLPETEGVRGERGRCVWRTESVSVSKSYTISM